VLDSKNTPREMDAESKSPPSPECVTISDGEDDNKAVDQQPKTSSQQQFRGHDGPRRGKKRSAVAKMSTYGKTGEKLFVCNAIQIFFFF
jgi:hypothetical protein